MIAVLVGMVAVFLVECIICSNSRDIVRSFEKRKVQRNLDKYIELIDDYEEKNLYIEIYDLWMGSALYYLEDSRLECYRLLENLCSNYSSVCGNINSYFVKYRQEDADEYYASKKDFYISDLASSYNDFVQRYNEYVKDYGTSESYSPYVPACYEEKHMESYRIMRENLRCMISYYFGIPYDEMDQFDSFTQAQKCVRLTEAIEEMEASYEE